MSTTFRVLVSGFLAVLFSSCLDVETSTVVHRDGSVTRTIFFTGDSASVYSGHYPLPLDSSWQVSIARKDEKTLVYRAERTFAHVRDLNRGAAGTRGKTLTSVSDLDESFRWFFTIYRYTETWKCYRVVDAVPLSAYLSDADLDFAYRHEVRKDSTTAQDSTRMEAIKERYEEWEKRNIFEAYYREFIRGVQSLHSPRLAVSDVERQRHRLYDSLAADLVANKTNLERTSKRFGAVLGSSAARDAFRANAAGFDSLKALLDFEESGHGSNFTASVTMPGLIVTTNAEGVEGNTAHWKDAFALNELRDVTLDVESRVINWWAVIGTGIAIAAILAYLLVAAYRRKPRTI